MGWVSGGRKLARPCQARPVLEQLAAAAAPAAAVETAARVKVKGKTTTDILAGGLARAASQSTIHPLDTIKVRMQAKTQSAPASTGKYGVGSSAGGATGLAASVRGVGKQVGSLYKGCGGAASGAGIAIGTYFAFYGATLRALQEHTDLAMSAIAFIAGSAGAIGSSVVKVPAAVCIRSVQANLYPNVLVAASQITKKAGVRGLFTGYLPTLVEDVPDMAVKFAAYESMRSAHERFTGRSREQANKLEDLMMGGVAGAAAAAATTPLDVIKTRMMVCAGSKGVNVFSAGRAVLAESGWRGFLVGCGPRTLSNFINSGIFFVFFEGIRAALIKHEEAQAVRAEAKAQEKAAIAVAAAAAAMPARPHAPAQQFEASDETLDDVLSLARGSDRFALAAQASLTVSHSTASAKK